MGGTVLRFARSCRLSQAVPLLRADPGPSNSGAVPAFPHGRCGSPLGPAVRGEPGGMPCAGFSL